MASIVSLLGEFELYRAIRVLNIVLLSLDLSFVEMSRDM